MGVSRVAAAIPPQPTWIQQSRRCVTPLHLSVHRKLVYGCSTGVVVRNLPDKIMVGRPPVEVFGGSKRPITCATASIDGRVVAGGDNDGYCHVWLNESGEMKHSEYKLDSMRYVHLTDASLTLDGQRLAMVGLDPHSNVHGAIILTHTGARIGVIKGHAGGIGSAAFSPHPPYVLATAGVDGKLCLHQGPPYKNVKSVAAASNLSCVRWSPSGKYIAVAGSPGYLGVFDVDLNLMTDADLGEVSPISIAWCQARDDTFAVACDDNSIHILKVDIQDERITVAHNISTHNHVARGVLWGDNDWLLAPTNQGVIFGWKLATDTNVDSRDALCRQLECDMEAETAATSPAAKAVAPAPKSPLKRVGSRYKIIELDPLPIREYRWADSNTAQPHLKLFGPKGGPLAVCFERETNQLVIGTNMGYLMFLDAGMVIPQTFDVAKMDGDRQIKACITNGDYAAAISADGCLKMYRYRYTNIKGNAGEKFGVNQCIEILRGNTNATAYTPTRQAEVVEIGEFRVNDCQVSALSFLGSAGGKRANHVALMSTAGVLSVYSLGESAARKTWSVNMSSKPLIVSAASDGSVLCIAVKTNSTYPQQMLGSGTLTVEDEVVLEIYEVLDPTSIHGLKFIKVIPTGETRLSAMALSHDGSMVAYTSNTYIKVKATDAVNDCIVEKHWGDHRTKVADLSWSPTDGHLVSTSAKEIFIWNVDQLHKTLRIKDNHNGYNLFARFLFENVVISAGSEGLLKIHEVEFD